MSSPSVCFVGAGFVGGPSGAVLALKNPHIRVEVADLNEQRIAAWKSDRLPLYEPGLFEVVKEARDGIHRHQNLFFTTDVRESIKRSDVIFICVNTPTKTTGAGAGRASNLTYLEKATRLIAQVAESDKIIVEKSTVPCRTAATITEILNKTAKPGLHFDVLSNPEFLAEGTAIRDLLSPDRILIGCLDSSAAAAARLKQIYSSWVPEDRILTTNLWSSELAKVAANALLAQRISSMNALSAICEATGADVGEIAHAAGLDSRIGPKMLQASVGFGGSCFRKDVLNLAYMAESLHLPEVAAYWQSVVSINKWQKHRFTKSIVRGLYNTVSHKKIAILGFAYKKNTSDTRESPAITVVKDLIDEEADVHIYDPQVTEASIHEELVAHGCQDHRRHVTVCKTAYEALEDAHAAVILTEWDEFSNKDHAGRGETKTKTATSWQAQQRMKRLANWRPDPNLPSPALTDSSGDSDDNDEQNSTWSESLSLKTGLGLVMEDDARGQAPEQAPKRSPAGVQERLDWEHVAQIMQPGPAVFDGRRVVDIEKLQRMGFHVECVGSGRQ